MLRIGYIMYIQIKIECEAAALAAGMEDGQGLVVEGRAVAGVPVGEGDVFR